MRLTDYAWYTSLQIIKQNNIAIKILFKEETSPLLSRDKVGYLLYLPIPKIYSHHAEYQGISFDLEEATHKRMLWGLFKASLFHLSLHVSASDYSMYSDWVGKRDPKLFPFVISLVEDAALNAFLRVFWSTLIPSIAYANALSYLLLKPAGLIPREQLKLMASILSVSTLRLIKGDLKETMREDVVRTVSYLKGIEETVYEQQLLKREDIARGENNAAQMNVSVIEKKLDYADRIYEILAKYGPPSEAPALPYAEHHGRSTIFVSQLPNEKQLSKLSERASMILNSDAEVVEFEELTKEAEQNIADWLVYEEKKNKTLSYYLTEGINTRFHSFGFPDEDYAEFLRRKESLAGPIRRTLTRLILYQNIEGDDPRKLAGNVDLQDAIQVIASKSDRTDVFVTEELQNRRMTWSILVDVSRSLKNFMGQAKDVAMCLSEVVNGVVFDPNTWGIFAFDNNFYIVKDFSERYSNDVKARIGGLRNSGLTYLPDAIKLMTRVLNKRYEEDKVLVVVSDGFPSGYEGVEDELLKSVKGAIQRDIGVIGVGIGSRAVKKYFKISCVVETPYDLMKRFADTFFEYTSML